MDWQVQLRAETGDGKMPETTETARTELEAAALALVRFIPFNDQLSAHSRLEVKVNDVPAKYQPYSVEAIHHWLTVTKEGQAFAKAESADFDENFMRILERIMSTPSV